MTGRLPNLLVVFYHLYNIPSFSENNAPPERCLRHLLLCARGLLRRVPRSEPAPSNTMARQRRSQMVLAALLLAILALGGAAAQAPVAPCSLVLHLNATASTLSLDGSGVVEPVIAAQPLAPAFPAAAVGMEGALTLALPGAGPCPTTTAALAAALAGATLQTVVPAGPLLLYPADGITVSSSCLTALGR